MGPRAAPILASLSLVLLGLAGTSLARPRRAEDVLRSHRVAKQIDRLAAGLQPSAPRVSLLRGGDQEFDCYRCQIHIPRESIKAKKPRSARIGFAHEYGHALFEYNMRLSSPRWQALRDQLDPVERRWGASITDREVQLSTLMDAYSELFADFTAATWARSPAAISRLLKDASRGFSTTNKAALAKWQEPDSLSSYRYFYPVRRPLWEQLGTPARRKAAVAEVFQILKTHFDASVDAENPFSTTTKQRLNGELIQRLTAAPR